MSQSPQQHILFSDYFGIQKDIVENYGAFNVSLLADLPLFIDPFLIFQNPKPECQKLHDDIIKYLSFLQSKSLSGSLNQGLLDHWYRFPEVKQTWLGFSLSGNSGTGLGKDFARNLDRGFNAPSMSLNQPRITKSNHIEKFCLIGDGVGKDNISDFVTNLIKEFLLSYTQDFARRFLAPAQRKEFSIPKVRFDYSLERWLPSQWELPCWMGDYVVLVPRDLLTRDDTWINKGDLIHSFETIALSVEDTALRSLINNYFEKVLPDNPNTKQKLSAIKDTLGVFPQLIDYYIKMKEDDGDKAVSLSDDKVNSARSLFLENFPKLASIVANETSFYDFGFRTLDDSLSRVECLKQAIENKDGFRLLLDDKGKPIVVEGELKIAQRFLWFNSQGNPNADTASTRDAIPVDFKLASSIRIEKFLQDRDKEAVEREESGEGDVSIKPTIVVVFAFFAYQKQWVEDCVRKLRSKSRHVRVIGAFAQGEPQMKEDPQMEESPQAAALVQAQPIEQAVPAQTAETIKNPTAFISYTHDVDYWVERGLDPQTQRKRVLDLCKRLRNDGVDCIVDQLALNPAEGWPLWMLNNIREADFVIVVATETYSERFYKRGKPGVGLGGQWEGGTINQELYDAGGQNLKFIPVVFDHSDAQYIPSPLRGATRYDVSNLKENDDAGFDGLYFRLTGQPLHTPTPLGPMRTRPKQED